MGTPQSPTYGGVIIPLWVVERSPGGPELFWVGSEASGLLCSDLGGSGAVWEGLDESGQVC